MIKDLDGNKITANQYAKHLILDKFDFLLEGYWIEENEKSGWYNEDGTTQRFDDLTQAEIAKIEDMLRNRIRGVTKYLGYIPYPSDHPYNNK
tara:strand:+ start:385 stop:660 length:276 start_codon:yes stop_codon:yes gene_type:complete